MESNKIIIIGGGIAGITLALFLKKAGISSIVYEAQPQFKKAGVAFTIAPNGMRIMQQLGLADAIKNKGNNIAAYQFQNDKGGRIATMRTGPVERFVEPPVMIERFLLQQILNDEAIKQNIEIQYGKKLETIFEENNQIYAVFKDGSSSKADLLIGGDGIHSSTRKLLFPNGETPTYVGFYGTGGLVDSKAIPHGEKLVRSDINLVYGKNGFFGYGFDKPNELLWWSSLEVPENNVKSFIETTTDEQIRNHLLTLFKDYTYPVKELIKVSPQFTQTASYELGEIKSWHSGRCLLIGDAAHALSTTSGQGVSMAFEDALYLAKLLRDQGLGHYEQIFKAFEKERQPRIAAFREEAKRGNDNKKITNSIKLWIREKLMSFFIGLFAEKGLEWQYGYQMNWND